MAPFFSAASVDQDGEEWLRAASPIVDNEECRIAVTHIEVNDLELGFL